MAPKILKSKEAGEERTIEVEHINAKAADLPADVTVTQSSGESATGGGEGRVGDARGKR